MKVSSSGRIERLSSSGDHPLFANHPKIQDLGAVYCGIAWMLNLLVIFDVLLRITGSVREDPGSKNKSVAMAGAGSGK